MAIQIQKRVKVESQFKMVKLQLLLYTFFKDLGLSDAELSCAALLALKGFKKSFFKEVVEEGIFKTEQSVRNCMSKLKTTKVALKEGKDWRINPEIAIGVDKVILLDLKAVNIK